MTNLHYAKKGDRFIMPEPFGGRGVVTVVTLDEIGDRGSVFYTHEHGSSSMPASDFAALAVPENRQEWWARMDAEIAARMSEVEP